MCNCLDWQKGFLREDPTYVVSLDEGKRLLREDPTYMVASEDGYDKISLPPQFLTNKATIITIHIITQGASLKTYVPYWQCWGKE